MSVEIIDAVRCENIEKLQEMLLDKDIDVNETNERGYNCLLAAVRRQYIKMSFMILDSKRIKDINARNEDGNTALIFSCCNEVDIKLVERLLQENDINVNITCNEGYSALLCACVQNLHDIIKLLIDKGAILHVKKIDRIDYDSLILISSLENFDDFIEINKEMLLDHEDERVRNYVSSLIL